MLFGTTVFMERWTNHKIKESRCYEDTKIKTSNEIVSKRMSWKPLERETLNTHVIS